MISITISADASRTIEIVQELKTEGLVLGNDFDYAYHPSWYDNESTRSHCAVFSFYTESYASFFAIKYIQ